MATYKTAVDGVQYEADPSVNAGIVALKRIAALDVPLVSKTAAYTVGTSDEVILANATSAAFSVTLPTAVGITGRKYTIKKTDSSANAVTVATTSSQTIDGAASYSLSAQWQRVTVVSDGANWQIIGT